mmetsp:Transcript_47010/g.62229  ORF Transcript_47010/g.62229 Transcript_47010/m.62229 type:complete len:85 (-) Transcript_47010:182-436(-)
MCARNKSVAREAPAVSAANSLRTTLQLEWVEATCGTYGARFGLVTRQGDDLLHHGGSSRAFAGIVLAQSSRLRFDLFADSLLPN